MDINIYKDNKKDDIKISKALMSIFVILAVQYVILINFNLFGTIRALQVQTISKILVGIAFLYSLPSVLKRSKIKALFTILLAVFILLVHFVMYPENREYMIPIIIPFFTMSIPSFLYALSIYDWEVFESEMKKSSKIIFIIGVLIGFLVFTGNSSIGLYSMSLSYYLLLPSLIYLNGLFGKPTLNNVLPFIISVLVIIALGSRGPLLCIVVFFVFKFVVIRTKQTYKSITLKLSFIILSIGLLMFQNQIISSLYNLLIKYGIRSRTLLLLVEGKFSTSTSRMNIFHNLINSLMDTPLIGIGIAGDRRINSDLGLYAHNFILEVLLNYGIIFGVIVLMVMLYLLLNIFLMRDNEKHSMLITWMCLGFVHLMISSSYITDFKFWIFIGLSLNYVLLNKKNKNSSKDSTKLDSLSD